MSTKTQQHSRMFDRVDTYDEETGAYIHSHMERRADAGIDIVMHHFNINTGETIAVTEILTSLRAADDAAKDVQKTKHRVALDDMLKRIVSEEYIFPNTLPSMTICVLQIDNGFALVGKSAPADPDNYDVDAGKDFAKQDAIRQMWVLEGYLLRERLSL